MRKFLDKLVKFKAKILISIGDIFDPYYQKRTNALDDLNKQREKETKDMLDRIFRIGKYKDRKDK
jgi:hypothetical protein